MMGGTVSLLNLKVFSVISLLPFHSCFHGKSGQNVEYLVLSGHLLRCVNVSRTSTWKFFFTSPPMFLFWATCHGTESSYT